MPAGPERDTVVALTCGVVVLSIFVQGLSIGRVTRRSMARN
jgi:NhaP-type Na+/H+ or K+/H+ antiporter